VQPGRFALNVCPVYGQICEAAWAFIRQPTLSLSTALDSIPGCAQRRSYTNKTGGAKMTGSPPSDDVRDASQRFGLPGSLQGL
jgi:hypothetical protein